MKIFVATNSSVGPFPDLLLLEVCQYPQTYQPLKEVCSTGRNWSKTGAAQLESIHTAGMELFSWFLPPIHGKTVECSLPACSFHQSLATQTERHSTGYYGIYPLLMPGWHTIFKSKCLSDLLTPVVFSLKWNRLKDSTKYISCWPQGCIQCITSTCGFLYQTRGNYVIFAWDGIHDLRQNPRRSVGVVKEDRICHLQILLWMVGENKRFYNGFNVVSARFLKPVLIQGSLQTSLNLQCVQTSGSHAICSKSILLDLLYKVWM